VGTRSTAPEEDGWVGDWRGDESPRFQPPPGLHERLTHQLGADADLVRGREISPLLAQIEQCAAELETDNHRLRQQITQLNSDVRDLNDALDAARAMNRDLMNELNRNAGLPVTYVQHTDASR